MDAKKVSPLIRANMLLLVVRVELERLSDALDGYIQSLPDFPARPARPVKPRNKKKRIAKRMRGRTA